MISQDDKERHQIRVVGEWRGEKPGFEMQCTCGKKWNQPALPNDEYTSMLARVACECGAYDYMDIRARWERPVQWWERQQWKVAP